MTGAGKELVRRHFEEIFNRQNLDVCDEIMAKRLRRARCCAPRRVGSRRVNGPRATRATAAWLLAQFPDLHMTIEALVAEEDTVAVRILSEGTNLGDFNGMPPTCKCFSARQSHWFRVQDGKLAEHWATREDLPVLMQLGILQPPGRPPS